MANYIDVDKLKAEIERRIALYSSLSENTVNPNRIDEDRQILRFLSTLESGKPVPKNLEEEAVNWICNHKNGEVLYVKDAFIAGAKWQAEQLLKSSPLPEDTVLFNKGVEEGKRLMMMDAVDAIVEDWNPDPEPEITIPLNPEEFTRGDKVRVLVLKKED